MELALSQADQYVLVFLKDSTDHITPETAITGPTITIKKQGGTYASPSDGTWTNEGNGYYSVTLDTDDTDTIGFLFVKVVKAGTDGCTVHTRVVRRSRISALRM